MAVIAIDGPAGAGKSSVSREVARRLEFQYLDTGAMYRCVGLAAKEAGVSLDDPKGLEPLLACLSMAFRGPRVLLNGRDVTDQIRTPEIDRAASRVSALAEVRRRLTELQRAMAQEQDLVAEGRDMGTVVFPHAELKVFLTASPEARARRRWLQLRQGGVEIPLERLMEEIEARDRADSSRAIAPLRPAEDAVVVDTTAMEQEEVVERVVELARSRIPGLTGVDPA